MEKVKEPPKAQTRKQATLDSERLSKKRITTLEQLELKMLDMLCDADSSIGIYAGSLYSSLCTAINREIEKSASMQIEKAQEAV